MRSTEETESNIDRALACLRDDGDVHIWRDEHGVHVTVACPKIGTNLQTPPPPLTFEPTKDEIIRLLQHDGVHNEMLGADAIRLLRRLVEIEVAAHPAIKDLHATGCTVGGGHRVYVLDEVTNLGRAVLAHAMRR